MGGLTVRRLTVILLYMDTTQAAETITIYKRAYSVTKQVAQNGDTQYILTDKRGAVYGTMRNVRKPELMFLVSASGRGLCSLGTVWLTDKNGTLELVSA